MNSHDIGNELRKSHFILGNDEIDKKSQYRYDFTNKLSNKNSSSQDYSIVNKATHLNLGEYPISYTTTAQDQNNSISKLHHYERTGLDENLKNDLRKSHFILGQQETNYQSESKKEFTEKKILKPLKFDNNTLRSHSYNLGNDSVNYVTETHEKFISPIVNKSHHVTAVNQSLQHVNYKLGNDSNEWTTSLQSSYFPKTVRREKLNDELKKSKIIMGDDKNDIKSTNQQMFQPYKYQKVNQLVALKHDLTSNN